MIPPELCIRPFRGSAAVAAGLLTWRQLEGDTWRRVLPDVYVRADLALTHQVLCAAAVIWARRRGVISGGSAAYLLGVDVLARDAPVQVTVPGAVRLRPPPGIEVVRSPLRPVDVTWRQRIPMTAPVRTAFDLARRKSFVEAVVGLDGLAGALLIEVDEVAAYAFARSSWPGSRRVPAVLDAVEPRSESPMETRSRLILVGAGLPRPVAQHTVFDDSGRVVARLDLAYPERRVGIEYEGDHHRERPRFQRDLNRYNELRQLGWTMIRVGSVDVYTNPTRMIQLVCAALS
jgi:hypothetical protein